MVLVLKDTTYNEEEARIYRACRKKFEAFNICEKIVARQLESDPEEQAKMKLLATPSTECIKSTPKKWGR